MTQANIFHELLHFDEATTYFGKTATGAQYLIHSSLTSAMVESHHDIIRNTEAYYHAYIERGDLDPNLTKPELNKLPWKAK